MESLIYLENKKNSNSAIAQSKIIEQFVKNIYNIYNLI